MGDPPVRRPLTKPPPIPRAPIAPSPAKTDVVPAQTNADLHAEELSEVTRNLEAPDAGELVERMLDLVASEAEALLVGDENKERLADLNVRTALASWDGLHETEEALRYLELAESHPLAPRLRIAAALGQPAPEPLAAAQLRIEALAPSELATALAIDVAEAWLFRYGKPELAGALVDRVLATTLPPGLREHVGVLGSLAHASAGHWDAAVRVRRAAIGSESSLDAIAATAALVLDRTHDAAGALQLCWDALRRAEAVTEIPTGRGVGDTQPTVAVGRAGMLRVLDVAIDAAMRDGDARQLELLDRRAELIAALPGGALEALATRHAVAAGLTRDGQHTDATALWIQLGDDPASTMTAAGRRIATLQSTWTAAAAGDQKAALAAHRRLADSDCIEVASSHAWRALELAAAAGETPAAISDLAHAVASTSDSPSAEWWLDLVEHATPTAGAIARLESRGGLALRWAATLAEKLGNTPRALELWRRACALDGRLGTEYDHVVRVLRNGDEDDLAEAYTLWALAEPDGRTASALQCARGVVDLVRGDFVEAEETLQRAADLDPKDVFCRAALASVYRAGKRFDLLAHTLAELSSSLTNPDARAAAAREYAELLD